MYLYTYYTLPQLCQTDQADNGVTNKYSCGRIGQAMWYVNSSQDFYIIYSGGDLATNVNR